jgi:hypothetical protein
MAKLSNKFPFMFSVKLGEPDTETLEMFPEAFGKHSLRRTLVLLNNIHVSRPVECQLKVMNV